METSHTTKTALAAVIALIVAACGTEAAPPAGGPEAAEAVTSPTAARSVAPPTASEPGVASPTASEAPVAYPPEGGTEIASTTGPAGDTWSVWLTTEGAMACLRLWHDEELVGPDEFCRTPQRAGTALEATAALGSAGQPVLAIVGQVGDDVSRVVIGDQDTGTAATVTTFAATLRLFAGFATGVEPGDVVPYHVWVNNGSGESYAAGGSISFGG